eukprot:540406-Rhodomonas_salina.1
MCQPLWTIATSTGERIRVLSRRRNTKNSCAHPPIISTYPGNPGYPGTGYTCVPGYSHSLPWVGVPGTPYPDIYVPGYPGINPGYPGIHPGYPGINTWVPGWVQLEGVPIPVLRPGNPGTPGTGYP